ncbi:MAG: 5'/3'-nucleotidase SurE [Pirellulaceae bacterium]
MKILITNDDGWDAIGLDILYRVAGEFGQVTAIAPERPSSGISHQLTLHRPMALIERERNRYSLDGTPADCVRVALAAEEFEFDVVLSGVNDGGNLGADLFLSGTVAGAREANFHDLPAMSISQYRKRYNDAFDWTQTETMLRRVLRKWFSGDELPASCLINVNLPDPVEGVELGEISIVECPVDTNSFPAQYSRDENRFSYAGRYSQREISAGSDMDVCFGGKISWSRTSRNLNVHC